MELGLDLKLRSWSWNWSWNLRSWNWSWSWNLRSWSWSWSWYSGDFWSWNWSWSWNLRSWSWSWYSGDWPELELELKPLELELELILWSWPQPWYRFVSWHQAVTMSFNCGTQWLSRWRMRIQTQYLISPSIWMDAIYEMACMTRWFSVFSYKLTLHSPFC